MVDLLPDVDEPEAADDGAREYYDDPLTVDETPFTATPRGANRQLDHFHLQDALSFYDELKARGEADDEDFMGRCSSPPSHHDHQSHPSEFRWRKWVGPILASAPDVERVGAMGLVDGKILEGNKVAVREAMNDELGGEYDHHTLNFAASLYLRIRRCHLAQNRRVTLWELKEDTDQGHGVRESRVEECYRAVLPQLESVDPPTRRGPDWEYTGGDE